MQTLNLVITEVFHLPEHSSLSADPDATLDDEEEEAFQEGLLSGKYFTVAGFSSEQLTHLRHLIEGNGGKAVASGQTADYAVLPMNTVLEEDLHAKQLVSNFMFAYLQYTILTCSCVEENNNLQLVNCRRLSE